MNRFRDDCYECNVDMYCCILYFGMLSRCDGVLCYCGFRRFWDFLDKMKFLIVGNFYDGSFLLGGEMVWVGMFCNL